MENSNPPPESSNDNVNYSNRFKPKKYSNQNLRNRYPKQPHPRNTYFNNHRNERDSFTNRYRERTQWNSYHSNDPRMHYPQNHNSNFRPRHHFNSQFRPNALYRKEYYSNYERPFFDKNSYDYSKNSSYDSYEQNADCTNNSSEILMKNPFSSCASLSENPVNHSKTQHHSKKVIPSTSKEKERSKANTNSTKKLTDFVISRSNVSRNLLSASKVPGKRIRSRSLNLSESGKKDKDKTELEESEERRIKEWTDSLLETNNSQITRLINPSNQKEKAAVNHLITQFSKSKRKEILARTLRTNSSELTDDDKDSTQEVSVNLEDIDAEDKEILIIMDSRNENSDLEQNSSSFSSSYTSKNDHSRNDGNKQDLKNKSIPETCKSPANNSRQFQVKEKFVKRKSKGNNDKIKKKQKTTGLEKDRLYKEIEALFESKDLSKEKEIPEVFSNFPDNSQDLNQDSSVTSDIKEAELETLGAIPVDPLSSTNTEKNYEQNLFSSDVSVDKLIELFASGKVKVKEEFNDPVVDAIRDINPDELINACSSNSFNNCDINDRIPAGPDKEGNSKNKSSLVTSINASYDNSNCISPVILGSVSDDYVSASATVRTNPLNDIVPLSDKNESENSTSLSPGVDKSSNNSLLNESNETKVELPKYLNNLIKQLRDITSEEEIVKQSLIEAKSKINEYACLLEVWKRKKKELHDQEEDLCKKRNDIIKSMQDAVETDDDKSKQKTAPSKNDAAVVNQLSSKGKSESESNLEVVDSSSSTPTLLSLLTEQNATPEPDEIIILPPPEKPTPPEIIIFDEEESTSVSNQNKQSRLGKDIKNTSTKRPSIFDLKSVDAHATVINCLVVFEDFLYTCANDNTAKRFSLKDACLCITYLHSAKNVTEVVVEKVQNEALVFTSCSTRLISLFIASNGTKIKSFFPPCSVMSICKGWGKFYSGLANGAVNVYNWKYEEMEIVKTEHPATRLATADQGRLHVLVILSSEGHISIRDAETGLLIRYIKTYIKHPSWMCLHNDLAYFNSSDKMLLILDVMSGRVERRIYLNNHSTGLAVYDDYIFTISYNGVIHCYNKDNSCDKKFYYGAGRGSLTCIHVYHHWVFTGNRKGNVSLFHFDPNSSIACEFDKCDLLYGLEEDLEYHIEKDHLSKKKSSTECDIYECNWRGCHFPFYRNADILFKMNHIRKHIYKEN